MRLALNNEDLRTSFVLLDSLLPPACLRLSARSQRWISSIQLEDSGDLDQLNCAGPVSQSQWQKQRIFEIGRQLHTCYRCLKPPMRPPCVQNDAANFAADYLWSLRSPLTFVDAAMICEVVFGSICFMDHPVVVDSVIHSRVAPYILTALEIYLAGERPEACWHTLSVLKSIAASQSDAADHPPMAFQELAPLYSLATGYKADLQALLDVSLAIKWRNGPTNAESVATAFLDGYALLHHSSKTLPAAECWALAVKIRAPQRNKEPPSPNELLYALRGLQLVIDSGTTSGARTSDMMARIECVDWTALFSGRETPAEFERRTNVRTNRIPSILNENIVLLAHLVSSYSRPVSSGSSDLKTVVNFLRQFWLGYLKMVSSFAIGNIDDIETYRRAQECCLFYEHEGIDFAQTFRWQTTKVNALLSLSTSETSRRLQGLYGARESPAESYPQLTPLLSEDFEGLLTVARKMPRQLRLSLLAVMVEALQQVMNPHTFLRRLGVARKSEVHSQLSAWPAAMRKCQSEILINPRNCVSDSFGAHCVAATLPHLHRESLWHSTFNDQHFGVAVSCIGALHGMLKLLPVHECLALQKGLNDCTNALQETQKTMSCGQTRAENHRVHNQERSMLPQRRRHARRASRRAPNSLSDPVDDRESSEQEATKRNDSIAVIRPVPSPCRPHVLRFAAPHTASQIRYRPLVIGCVTLSTAH